VRDVDADTERVAFDRGRVPPLAGVFIVLPVGFEEDDDEAECALPDLVTLLGGSAVRALFAADPRSSAVAGRTAGVTPTLVTDLMGMYPGCGVVPLVGGAEPAREEPVIGAGPEPKVEGACFRLFEGAGAGGAAAAAAAAAAASACSCSGSELSNRSRIRSLWTRNALPCASSHAVKAFCRSFSSYNELASVSHKRQMQAKAEDFTLGFSFCTRLRIFSSSSKRPGLPFVPRPSSRLASAADAANSSSSVMILK
jgi:hypothetical protein